MATAKKPAPAALVTAPQVTLESLQALSMADLIAQLKSEVTRQGSHHIGLAKRLVVLDMARDETVDKTLKGYIRKTVGVEIESATYKVANAWAMVGEGHGHILESHFDASALNWLLTTSAILGYLEKEDGETGARIREQVAVILRKPTKKTDKALKAIRDMLKPDKVEKEDEDEEVEVTLNAALFVALQKALDECEDAEVLEMAGKAFEALSEVASERLKAVRIAAAQAAPVEAVAA